IAGVLGTQGVSIEQMVQQGHEPDANVPVHVVVLTHTAREAQVSEALCRINELPAVVQPTCRLRVEDR
ncbi:MAG: homoserine dehydrogenase, partial [Polyangiales bacterium]